MTDAYATDDGLKLAKLAAYVDDGRDYTARIVWYMNRRRYLHEKRIIPMPPAPKVAAGSVEETEGEALAAEGNGGALWVSH